MFKDIYNILKEDNKRDKVLDLESLNKILQLFIEKFNLRKDLIIEISKDDNPNVLGCYDLISSNISINIDNQIKKSEIDDIYIINVYILQTLIHEITHIRQIKQLSDFRYAELSNPLIKLEYLLNYIDYYSLSTKYIEKNYGNPSNESIKKQIVAEYGYYHDLFPMERMAEITSLRYVKNIIDKCEDNQKIKELASVLLNLDLVLNYSYGYVKLADNVFSSPVDLFIEKFNLLEFYPEVNKLIYLLESSNRITDKERFKYGLPISLDSYETLANNGRKLIHKKKELLNKN